MPVSKSGGPSFPKKKDWPTLTFKQIARNTSQSRHDLSHQVKVLNLKFGLSKTVYPAGNLLGVARTYTPDTSYLRYTTSIEIWPGDKVKLSCSCDDFKYRWEYALWLRNCADIIYSNGEPPLVNNSYFKPMACKHLIALHNALVLKGKISSLV